MSDNVVALVRPAVLKEYTDAVTAGEVHQWIDGQFGTAERFNKNVKATYDIANAVYNSVVTMTESNDEVLETVVSGVTALETALSGTGSVTEVCNETASYVATQLA